MKIFKYDHNFAFNEYEIEKVSRVYKGTKSFFHIYKVPVLYHKGAKDNNIITYKCKVEIELENKLVKLHSLTENRFEFVKNLSIKKKDDPGIIKLVFLFQLHLYYIYDQVLSISDIEDKIFIPIEKELNISNYTFSTILNYLKRLKARIIYKKLSILNNPFLKYANIYIGYDYRKYSFYGVEKNVVTLVDIKNNNQNICEYRKDSSGSNPYFENNSIYFNELYEKTYSKIIEYVYSKLN
jgi:hypothetical protein